MLSPTRTVETCEGLRRLLFLTHCFYSSKGNPNKTRRRQWTKCKNQVQKNTAQVPPPEEEESIFMEIPKPKAKKTVNIEIQEPNSPKPTSYQLKLPYPRDVEKVIDEYDKPSAQQKAGIAEDVVVRVDGFTFLADFVVVNFEPDPRVPIILERPFLRTTKALIDLYEENLTLRVGSDELVFYAEKSEKSKNKQFAHAISVIDFLKDEPFSGSTTNHSDALPPSSSPVKTSDNLEEFADELTLLKKVVHEENFQVYSKPLFEFDDNFTSSNVNPLFNEMDEDVENKNSNVLDSDEPVLLNTPLTDKVECFAHEDDIDEIDTFLAMEVSSNFKEGYFDSEGDVIFLENLLSDNTTYNLALEVISDHEPEQNESSITFSPRSDPLHNEFAGELLTLPSRTVREHEDYLNRMTLLCEISNSRSQENVHANQSSIIESLPISPIPVEDSELVQEEINIFLVPDYLIPPGVENDDSEDEDNELPNLDHQDNPSSPRPPPEPPDV
ncbi:reverse transcriptase domain-containing protein [Tanacetum coccineum]